MEKPEHFPEMVFKQLLHAHHDRHTPYEAQYFIVVDLRSNFPQAVDVLKHHHGIAVASLYDASFVAEECAPVAILDRASALWVISQSAIANAEDNELHSDTDECQKEQPVYMLLPVFSAIIPDCLIKNAGQ